MSALTPAEVAEVRTIVAEMIGQALRGADGRLAAALHAATPTDALTMRVSSEGASASSRSVFDVLVAAGDAPHGLAKAFPDFLDAEGLGPFGQFRLESLDLLFGEAVVFSAGRALKVVFKPSDRYLDFAAAVARDFGMACDLDLHGWPFLSSSGCCSTTIAEAGGVTNASGGGLA